MSRPSLPASDPPRFSRVEYTSFRWWERKLREVDFDLDRLAAETGVNRRRISTEFRRHCWVGLRKWIREQRSVRARDWLKRMLPVKEVAAIMGYRHVSRFIVEFRSVYNISPGGFQRGFRDVNEWAWTDEYRRSRRAIRLSEARAKRKRNLATAEKPPDMSNR